MNQDFYDRSYDETPFMDAWRALGALRKAANVRALAGGLRPRRTVEIGCGNGALLAELDGFGERVGYEISPLAAALAAQRPGITAHPFDGARVPEDDDAFDLAILSHVLEHLEQPLPLLREAARLAPAVLVEVPLEDNLSGRRAAHDAIRAQTGHLQRFDRAAVRSLIAAAGLEVRADRTDPLELAFHTFFGRRPRAYAKAGVRRAVHTVSPALARRTFTVHYAALAVRPGS